MTRILFVGQKPETVDFSDPSLPPGFDAEKINAGIAVGVRKIEERGWQGETCMITPDAAGGEHARARTEERHLRLCCDRRRPQAASQEPYAI
jgi:hypothetical protein